MFFKPVRSKTKFWQMIGRGTRLCPDLFGPGQDKHDFLVFDFCGNFDFFDIHPDAAEGHLTRPLSERVFTHRVDLLIELDSAADSPIEAELRRVLAERLSAEVRGLNVDDFVVRPHLLQVEFYADTDNWHRLSPERRDDVAQHLAPLAGGYRDPSESEHGEEARRFDLVALKLQLGVLGADPGFARLRDQVKDIATILLEVGHPDVDAQIELLEQLAGDDWWDGVTVSMLETMRKRVRGLVRHIERAKRSVVYADFRDELGEIQVREVQGVSLGIGFNRFKQKVRTYLRSHENDLSVQKIKRNRQLTRTDVGELEKIFLEAGFGTVSDIDHAKGEHDGSFGLFLRSLTGLDHDAAKRAFDGFQAGRTLSGNQLHFVSLVIDSLAKNGTIDPGWLYFPIQLVGAGRARGPLRRCRHS